MVVDKWMGRKIYPMKPWGGCDVDDEWQIPSAEYWLKQPGLSDFASPYNCIE